MAAPDDDFDDSDVAPSISEANAELRRIAATRADEAFAATVRRAEKLSSELVLLLIDVHNWIGLLRDLKERK